MKIEKRVVAWLGLLPAALWAAGPFDVRSFGAAGDGVTKDTAAIQKAIDAAHAAGGGEVFVPAGTFISGTLYLKSHVDMHLGPGAVLKASPHKEDYNAADAFAQNGVCLRECSFGAHFILCVEQEDVTLRGPGRVDGNSAAFLVDPKRGLSWRQVKGDPNPAWTGGDSIPWRPSQMIEFVESRNIRVSDLEIADSPYWSLFIWGCEQVAVRGCWIHNERDRFYTHNGDGIDIDSSRHVTVSDCRIRVCDDAITLRASHARLKRKGDCAFVTVANCTLSSLCNAVRVGVGAGNIHDALFENIAVHDSRTVLSFVSAWDPKSVKGVDMQRIKFANWTIADARGPLVKMTGGDVAPGVKREARIRDISFDNFTGTVGRKSLLQGCSADQPIENVVFRNIDVPGFLETKHVKNVRFENCAFTTREPRALSVTDFGAKPENTPAANAAAIQKAIDTAHAEGGDTVVVPPGTFVSGTLYLKSYVNLKLEKGAVLKASGNLADYNRPDAYPENYGCPKEFWNACHFIIGYEVSDVRIFGEGTIDGNGLAFFDDKPLFTGTECWREGMCVAKDRQAMRPGQLVVFIRGNDLVVSGITIRDAPSWSLYFAGSHRVRVLNYTVRNGRRHGNTDGVDIECCSDVILSHLDVDTGDDGIAIRGVEKRGGFGKACEHIRIRNCRLRAQAMGIRFGVGAGEIRDVTVDDVKVETAGWALAFQSFFGKPAGQGVDMEDITIRNLRAEKGCYGGYEVVSGGAAQKYGIRGIRLENCVFDVEHRSRIRDEGSFKTDIREMPAATSSRP